MALFVGKTHDFIFKARAVARPDAVNFAAVKGRRVDIFQNHTFGFFVGVSDIAIRLVFGRGFGVERKRHSRFVAFLHFQNRKIDAAAIDARGRAGFKAAQGDLKLIKRRRKRGCGEHAVRSAFIGNVADIDAPAEERAGCKYHAFRGVFGFQARGEMPKTLVIAGQIHDFRLFDVEIFLLFERVLHIFRVFAAVNLGAQGMHRRTFAAVEHTRLDFGFVRRLAHFAAERINFTHQMPFGGAAY